MNALNSGHLSVIEHLPLTFLVEDVSRALTHQLVRHRIASYSQQSQRYAKVNTNEDWYITPISIKIHKDRNQVWSYKENDYTDINSAYEELMDIISLYYDEFIKAGIPNEDARMILPNACFTSIIVTMNARSLIEQSSKRLCNRAQWEIRELYTKMVELIKDIYPTVYNLCTPPCKTSTGCKEKYPCNKS